MIKWLGKTNRSLSLLGPLNGGIPTDMHTHTHTHSVHSIPVTARQNSTYARFSGSSSVEYQTFRVPFVRVGQLHVLNTEVFIYFCSLREIL